MRDQIACVLHTTCLADASGYDLTNHPPMPVVYGCDLRFARLNVCEVAFGKRGVLPENVGSNANTRARNTPL